MLGPGAHLEWGLGTAGRNTRQERDERDREAKQRKEERHDRGSEAGVNRADAGISQRRRHLRQGLGGEGEATPPWDSSQDRGTAGIPGERAWVPRNSSDDRMSQQHRQWGVVARPGGRCSRSPQRISTETRAVTWREDSELAKSAALTAAAGMPQGQPCRWVQGGPRPKGRSHGKLRIGHRGPKEGRSGWKPKRVVSSACTGLAWPGLSYSPCPPSSGSPQPAPLPVRSGRSRPLVW